MKPKYVNLYWDGHCQGSGYEFDSKYYLDPNLKFEVLNKPIKVVDMSHIEKELEARK